MFMHTSRDDSLLGTMRFVSRHEDTQIYGALLPKSMTNQAMLDSDSYKTYSAIATGAEPPKPKKTQKKSDSTISSEETPSKKKPAKSKKDVPSTKKLATKPKPTKKKAPVKADRGKGDGTDFESGVPDEQQRKISGTNEGTHTKLRVLDVPKYDSESEKESWGDSGEEEDDDKDDTKDDSDNDGNDDDGDNDDNDDDSDDKRTESDKDNHELTDEEDNAKEENEEEKDNAEELYRDVNVNLRKEDVEMTDVDQGGADQHNVSQVSGFEQVEEDAHVTLTAVHDTHKTEGLMQSSYVSSDFIDKLLKFKNASPADNEIASLMDTIVRHEEPSSQTSSLFTVPVTVIPEITSAFTTTIPPPPPSFYPLPQQAKPTPTPTSSEVTTLFLALPDFLSVFYLSMMKSHQLGKKIFDTSNNDEQPDKKAAPESDWYKKPEKPSTPDLDWNKRQHVNFRPPQTWISDFAGAEKPLTSFDELMDTSIDISVIVINRLNITNLTLELLVGPAFNLIKGTYKTSPVDSRSSRSSSYPSRLLYQQRPGISERWKFKQKILNFRNKRQRLLLMRSNGLKTWFLIYRVLTSTKDVYYRKGIIAVTSLKIMKWYDYGHLDEIKVRREDQQLYKPDLRKRTAFTAYSDPQGVIYTDQNNINRLMRTDELHKFSDGTLNYVQTALYDITSGMRMEYLPKKKWSILDKRRARVMIQDINKQLRDRRLMRSLEKFIGGREYGEDLKRLDRTI
ncbi:hypothetical protein Tco_1082277 [Tanacetum coccineum]|uniref:Uncharacterized protein n=1 Tax=Tanacetum coccineum TaxID=301880 RepID=A0ABQ5I1L3_9ASTR